MLSVTSVSALVETTPRPMVLKRLSHCACADQFSTVSKQKEQPSEFILMMRTKTPAAQDRSTHLPVIPVASY